MKTKRKVGRPKSKEPMQQHQFRATARQWAKWKKRSEQDGAINMARWMRDQLDEIVG